MDELYRDCFVVFLRDDVGHPPRPQDVEEVVKACGTYEEAARIRQQMRDIGKHCVIRSVGQAGGGD